MSKHIRRGRALVIAALVVGLSGMVGPAAAQDAANAARIGATADPVDAAIAISQATFPDNGAIRVAVGRDDVFADSLAGSALIGTDGPLLYGPGGRDGQAPDTLLDEITRVLGSGRGCGDAEVYLLGGTAGLSQDIEDDIAELGYCVQRLSGPSRVETAVAIAEAVAAQGRVTEVLLATADDWADAATGGAYAARAGAPVLLSGTDELHPAVVAALDELRPTSVTALGGRAALSDEAVADANARRVAGPTRAGTAAAILEEAWQGLNDDTVGVTVVNGYTDDGWVYALAGAVTAARTLAPMVYAERDDLPPETATVLDDVPFFFATVVGPAAALDGSVAAVVAAQSPRAALLSDLDPVQSDLESVALAAVDGLTYARSLAVPVSPEGSAGTAVYELTGDYDTFRAVLGVGDGSVDTATRIQYEILVGDRIARTEQVAFGQPVPVEVDLTGADRLQIRYTRLVGEDAVGVLGTPVLLGSGAVDLDEALVFDKPGPTDEFLADLRPVVSDFAATDQATLGGTRYPDSLTGTLTPARSTGSASYDLGRDYELFRTVVGVPAGSGTDTSVVQFDVFVDEVPMATIQLRPGEQDEFRLEIPDALRLRLQHTRIQGGDVTAVWGDAEVDAG